MFIGKQIECLLEVPEISYTLSFEEHILDIEELAEIVASHYLDEGIVWQYTEKKNSLELLVNYYDYANSSEESSLVQ